MSQVFHPRPKNRDRPIRKRGIKPLAAIEGAHIPNIYVMRSYRSYQMERFPLMKNKRKSPLHRAIRKTARHLHIEEIIFDKYAPRSHDEIDLTLKLHGVPGRRAALEVVAGVLLGGPAISNHAFRMISLASKCKRDRCLANKFLDIARRSIRRTTNGLSKWFYRAISDLKPLCSSDPGGLVHALRYVNRIWNHNPGKMLHFSKKIPDPLIGCWYASYGL